MRALLFVVAALAVAACNNKDSEPKKEPSSPAASTTVASSPATTNEPQPAASATRYRAYLTGVLRLLLVSSCFVNATLLLASLQAWEILEPTLVTYLPLATVLVAWTTFAIRAGDAGHRLPAAENAEPRHVQRDDDRHWHVAGMVYVNRRDPAVLVHRRTGMYWTLNLGNPVSWTLVAGIAVVALLTGLDVISLPTVSG